MRFNTPRTKRRCTLAVIVGPTKASAVVDGLMRKRDTFACITVWAALPTPDQLNQCLRPRELSSVRFATRDGSMIKHSITDICVDARGKHRKAQVWRIAGL
jgi:hypothetical protein